MENKDVLKTIEEAINETKGYIRERIEYIAEGEEINEEQFEIACGIYYEKSDYVRRMDYDDFINHTYDVATLITLKKVYELLTNNK